jgi:hypothetical protein
MKRKPISTSKSNQTNIHKTQTNSKPSSSQMKKQLALMLNNDIKPKEASSNFVPTAPSQKEYKNKNNNNNQSITETNEEVKYSKNGKKLLAKKHTWIYDELFIKKNIVDGSFEEEKDEEDEQTSNVKHQCKLFYYFHVKCYLVLSNKYNLLMHDIQELKKEKKLLHSLIENGGEDNPELEMQMKKDIINYKDLIEKCLRTSAELTKEILNLKLKIHELTPEEEYY